MARFPGAKWEPIPGHTDGPMHSHLGLVLHVNDADSYDLHEYFSRPDIEVSSHFQVTRDGRIFQYLDTAVSSWCQSAGNADYLSVETQGFPTERLTDLQVSTLASLYRWLHDVHGIPYQLANAVGQRGFAWHGMGGIPWGGHFGCPGDLRKAQRSYILDLAQGVEDMPTVPEVVAGVKAMLLKGGVLGDLNTQTRQLEQHFDPTLADVVKDIDLIKVSLAAIETKLGL